jgi:hypothetical protein
MNKTKLVKRKYHHGHRVEGVWVVAGVEKTAEKKFNTSIRKNSRKA